MPENEDLLKEKVRLLITRERELLAIRRKQKRLTLWLTLAQSLAELVDSKSEIETVCARVAERVVFVLDLHIAVFFDIQGSTLHPIAQAAASRMSDSPIEAGAAELFATSTSGSCLGTSEGAEGELARAVGLHRFLWHKVTRVGAPPLLFVAGYDTARAIFYNAFDEDDIAHFANTGRQLGLLLGNVHLLRDLEEEKHGLERRVEERTYDLADANRELAFTLESLREKDRRLAEDIEDARRFQEKILPRMPSRSSRIEFATSYLPLETVGGDVFDIHMFDDKARGYRLFLADATGHGVQAAMRTILIKTEYDRIKAMANTPDKVLAALSERLCDLFPDGEIICAGCCVDLVVEEDGARITYANAGAPPLLHWANTTPREVFGQGPLLGVDTTGGADLIEFRMARGDTLLVATDGLIEQRNDRGDGFEPIVGGMSLGANIAVGVWVDTLVAEMDVFRGSVARTDDITLVGIRIRPAGEE